MKLIDKSVLVAEIERRMDFHHKRGNQNDSCVEDVLYGILSYIDTLEVKDVDLDFTKEVNMWIRDNGDASGFFNVQELAKHFFELGMAVSNKAQKGE